MTHRSSTQTSSLWSRFRRQFSCATPAPGGEAAPFHHKPLPAAQDAPLEALGGRRRLLLVAEDPEQRAFLEDALRPSAPKWLLLPTAKTGPALVDLVRQQQGDGVVVLFQSGQSTVLEALQVLGSEAPDVQRLVLCHESDRPSLLRLKGIPPVILPRTVSREELDDRLTRAFVLKQWLHRPEVRAILPRIQAVPTLPASFQRALEALLDPNHSVDQVARSIALDPAVTVHILKIANSALFGRMEQVHNVAEAITLLGVNRVQGLILSAQGFAFVDEDACPGFHPQRELEHALEVAQTAERLAHRLGTDPRLPEMAFTTGVLHDIGKILLAANFAERYGPLLLECHSRCLDLHDAERDTLGISHAELGACLLGVWGLSLPVIEGVAWHHEPALTPSPGIHPLACVHAADCLIRKRAPDSRYLKSIGAEALLEP